MPIAATRSNHPVDPIEVQGIFSKIEYAVRATCIIVNIVPVVPKWCAVLGMKINPNLYQNNTYMGFKLQVQYVDRTGSNSPIIMRTFYSDILAGRIGDDRYAWQFSEVIARMLLEDLEDVITGRRSLDMNHTRRFPIPIPMDVMAYEPGRLDMGMDSISVIVMSEDNRPLGRRPEDARF